MAGLLDGLLGGSSGGLLEFLRNNAMNQQFGSGLPSDQAQYGQPSMQAMAQMPAQSTAPQAAIPQNAQPTQGQLTMQQPAQQPMQQPDMGDRFLSGIRALGNPDGLLNRLADAGSAFSGGSTRGNQTAQFLVAKGVDPAMARTIVSDPRLLRSVLPSVLSGGRKTDDIIEHERAQQDPAFAKYMESKRAGAGEVGLNPVWGEDTKGNPVLGQLNKRGEFVQTKLPPGVMPSKGVDKVDLGTEWGVISKVNGQIVGKYPKDIVGKESAEKVGQAQGAAKVALPAAEKTTTRALKMLEELEGHAGMSQGVGFILGRLPALTPAAADFRERVEQVDAMVFGDAVEVMRGLGALTDKEGPKITAARARLKTAKSEEDYKTALKDVREVFETGIENMRQKAGGGSAPAPAAAPKRIRLNADGTIAQ